MSVISFIVESLICSGLFLVLYRWMLAKKVSFRICRAYLIVTMVLSVTIPIMDVPLYPSENVVRLSEWTAFSFDDFGAVPVDQEEAVAVNHNSEAIKPESSAHITGKPIDLKLILTILYTFVVVISLALLANNTARIYRLRSKSKLTYEEDYTLAEHEDIKTPFSFIRTLFMGFNYEPQERRQILTHEASHVRHRHSYERLFMSVLRSIFWFNPFFWMAEKDLEEVQEWEADKDVLDEGWNLKTYRTTIFKQLFGYNPDITCGLNHSLTKQRFIMMTQSHRGKGTWIRLAATLPVIAATFFAFGCGTKQAEMTEVSTNLTDGTEATYIDMCPPCDATVSKEFNAGGAGRSHTGIDYVLNEGDPVYATADGEVSAITRDDSNGLMLTLKHADGYETRYAHLSNVYIYTEISFEGPNVRYKKLGSILTDTDHSDLTVTGGGKVYKGQLIGFAGSTGGATGPHLHFEVRKNGNPIDPSPLFTSDKPVKGPFIIDVAEGTKNPKPGEEYFIICNGKLAHKEDIGKLVEEFFAGTPMHQAVVHIKAQDSVPMGVITDIKEQLRNARALKVRYETHESTIEKRLPPAPKTDMYPATVDALAGANRRNIIVMRVNPNGEMFLGNTYVKGSLHNDDLYAKELARLKELISNPEESAECPEIEMMDIQMPDGSTRQFRVSKGMISFQNDIATSYEDYTKAMKLITTAYKELREEVSAEVFGKPLAELSDTEMQVIYRAVPMNVSEVEPRDVPARK